jgi:anti-sigma-K factor RskA
VTDESTPEAAGGASSGELERLRKENLALKEKLEAAKPGRKERHFWRSIAVWLLIVLACIFAIAGTLSTWVRTTTLDTNSFVNTIAPLVKQDAVAKAVSDAAVKKLFQTYNIEGQIESSLKEL